MAVDDLRDALMIEAVRLYVDGASGGYRSTPPESPPPRGLEFMAASDSFVSGRSLEEWPGKSADFRRRWEKRSPEIRRDLLTRAFPDADPAVLLAGEAAAPTTPQSAAHDEEGSA